MFSSFTQYLPSALQNTIPTTNIPETSQELPPQSNFDPSTDDEGDEEELIAQASREQESRYQDDDDEAGDQDRRKVKSKKEKMASETLIFVRPPPSKSNHPLNLQVQLVPPNSRGPSGVAAPTKDAPASPKSASSVNTVSTDDDRRSGSVARSSSTRSTQSTYSTKRSSSTASLASVTTDASGSSFASGRSSRRIVPLYNLQAHNVLTNSIVDAGTDARVAKFQKRGLELIDLAILEPVEVWGVRSKEAKKEGMKISVDEMGSIVHTNGGIQKGTAAGKNRSSYLQSSSRKDGSRPSTPLASATSSALSLASHVPPPSAAPAAPSPQVLVSPPPSRRTGPGVTPLPEPLDLLGSNAPTPQPSPSTRRSSPGNAPTRENTLTSPTTDAYLTSPTTPTRRASGIFGKLKFNSKRSSAMLSPAPQPNPEAASPQRSGFTEFAMAPLAAGDLRQRQQQQPAAATSRLAPIQQKIPHNSPPVSPNSFNSQSSTPLATTPRQQEQAPHVAPPPAAIAPQSGAVGHVRNTSLTGALSRGKNRLMGGMKSIAPAPTSMVDREGGSTIGPESASTHNPSGGARSFFGKLAAGLAANVNPGASGADRRSVITRNGTANSSPRISVDTAGYGPANGNHALQHSNSQQFIGRAGSDALHKASVESLVHPPTRPLANLLHQPVIPPSPGGSVFPSSGSQAQILPSQPNHMTLRQLQLRPPVLGLQPTYVSASGPHATSTYQAQQQQQPSTVSLSSTAAQTPLPKADDFGLGLLRKSESQSTFSAAETSEESPNTVASRKRRSVSTARDNSARNSVNFDRDMMQAVASSTILASNPKEKALMYVWLVRRWMKKRNGGGGGSGHHGGVQNGHGGSSGGGGGGGRGSSRGLFSNLVGRDRGNGDRDEAGKRGSWHAGVGIPALRDIGGGGAHSQQPSASSATVVGQVGGTHFRGQQSMLGPVVGGGFEVRFEWKRAKAKREKEKRGRKRDKEQQRKRGAREAASAAAGVDSGARGGAEEETPRASQPAVMADGQLYDSPRKASQSERRKNRMSTASLSSIPPEIRAGGVDSGTASSRQWEKEGDEEDEESDAEDSETPWVCTLKIRRVAPGGVGVGASDASGLLSPPPNGTAAAAHLDGSNNNNNNNNNSSEKEQIMRLKVGTLSQTPHHPKVVAMLKIPFPLADVEVERMEAVPRKGVGFGPQSMVNNEDKREPYNGLLLTAEEIKDIVCSTGLWLAVREGFGGVGKVNRKGDGWKIRG